MLTANTRLLFLVVVVVLVWSSALAARLGSPDESRDSGNGFPGGDRGERGSRRRPIVGVPPGDRPSFLDPDYDLKNGRPDPGDYGFPDVGGGAGPDYPGNDEKEDGPDHSGGGDFEEETWPGGDDDDSKGDPEGGEDDDSKGAPEGGEQDDSKGADAGGEEDSKGADEGGEEDSKGADEGGEEDSKGGDDEEKDAPVYGGFIFDSPFFNLRQVSHYFKQLEKAMEQVFEKEMAELSNDTFINNTEEVVDVAGRKFRVNTTVLKDGDMFMQVSRIKSLANETDVSANPNSTLS